MTGDKTYQIGHEQALLIYATLHDAIEQILPMRHTDPDVLPVVAAYNDVLDTLKRQGLEATE